MRVEAARYHDQMVGFVPPLEFEGEVENLFATQAVALYVTQRDKEPQHALIAEALLEHVLLYPFPHLVDTERKEMEWLGHIHSVLRQWLPDRTITIKPYEKQTNLHEA